MEEIFSTVALLILQTCTHMLYDIPDVDRASLHSDPNQIYHNLSDFDTNIPTGYCTQLIHINSSSTISLSVSCDIFTFQHESPKIPKILFAPPWFCSTKSYRSGINVHYHSMNCNHVSGDENTCTDGLGCSQNDEIKLFEVLLFSILAVSVAGNAALFMNLTRKKEHSSVPLDSNRQSEEAKQYLCDTEERRRKRKQDMTREREILWHNTIATLIGSLISPLLDETRKFNEWLESPD